VKKAIGIVANPEHVDILKQGIEVWNAWRMELGETIGV
jgi:hypothetical protein